MFTIEQGSDKQIYNFLLGFFTVSCKLILRDDYVLTIST